MVTQAPSVMEIGSALKNKEVTKSNKSVNVKPMIQQVKPVVDIVQFRQAYTKATNDGYKGKKSDFALQLEKEGVQVEGFEQYKDQMVKNSVAKDTRKSYFGMVANVLDQRYQNTKKQFARAKGMVENYDLTRDTPVGERLSKNIDVLKNWTATVGTPIGEGIASLTDIALNSLGRGIKTVTPDSVERYVTKQGKEIRETVKDKAFVQDAVGYLSKSAEEYNDWAMSNPDEAQILANVMNIADVALIGGGSKVAKEVVEGAGKKTMRMATVDEAKTMVQKKFKAVSDYVKMPKMGDVQDDLIDKFASKVGGLRQETIQTIRTNPLYEAVEKGELTRRGFGQEVLSAVEARRAEISELGSLYNNFRNPEIIVDLTPVKQNVKANILDKYKIKVTPQGLDFRNSKFANDTADQNAIKNAIDLITEDTLPADVALNRRQAISKMARFGSDVSGDGASVVREIRHQFNEQMHKDIKGLKAVDNQIAPEIQQIDSLVKDYYNKDGSLKDSFYSTITNIANKGKELKYDRLNKLIPDIDNRVSALKAFEDVENALNQKTGIYEKIAYYGSLFGVGTSVGGPLGGGAALLFGAKYADPKKIVEVLKKRGGAGIAVAEKLETNKALSAFDNEVIEKALRESGEQATDIATRGERRLPFLVDDSIEEVAQQTDNLTPQATQQLDNVATPTASLDELLKNATDEELKANGFTATMIKQFRKKNPLTKASTAESATQSIAGKADEVLQPPSAVSKVDDALPVGEKMGKKIYHATDVEFDKYNPGQNKDDFGTWFSYSDEGLTTKDAKILRQDTLKPGTKLITESKMNKLMDTDEFLDSDKPLHELLLERGYKGIDYENGNIQLFDPNADIIPGTRGGSLPKKYKSLADFKKEGVSDRQLQITPSIKKEPMGAYKKALEADVAEEVKPVLVDAYGISDFDTFKKRVSNSSLVDVKQGMQYIKDNNISLEEIYKKAQSGLDKAPKTPTKLQPKVPNKIDKIFEGAYDLELGSASSDFLYEAKRLAMKGDMEGAVRELKRARGELGSFEREWINDTIEKLQTNQPTTLAPLVKSKGLPQKAKSLDSADLTTSIKKAKAEGKTVEEFVKSKAPKYMREYVDKDGIITEHRYYDASYPKTFVAKRDIGEGIKKGDIVALVKEKNEINAIHSPYTKGGFKYTTERRVNLDDFTNMLDQTTQTPTPAVGLPAKTKQTANGLDSADLTSSIKKAKAEGKTFEDYISSQEKEGKILYHGSKDNITEFDKSKSKVGEAVFFTKDKGFAKVYGGEGGNINKVIIPENVKTIDFTDPKQYDNFVKEVNKIYPGLAGKMETKEIKNALLKKDYMFIEIETLGIKDALRKLGYDGYFVYESGLPGYEKLTKNIALFDTSKIKTEAQLRKIREEANKAK